MRATLLAVIVFDVLLLGNVLCNLQSAFPSSKDNSFCPDGWALVDLGPDITCLYISNSTKSFYDANSTCVKAGAGLVKNITPKKHTAMRNVGSKRSQDFWVGLHKERGYDKIFKWVGTVGDGRAEFFSLPNTAREYVSFKEQCGYFSYEPGELELDECETENYFMCEKPSECKDGFFGSKCKQQCHCKGEPCNRREREENRCLWGCEPGWMGAMCDQVKQEPEVKYYCIDPPNKGKYVYIRIYTKGVVYNSIYGLDKNYERSSWCKKTQITRSADLYVISILLDDNTVPQMDDGKCAGERVDNTTYEWTLVIQENEGILLENDVQVTIQCNFTQAETMTIEQDYNISSSVVEMKKQKVAPETTDDDVMLQVVDAYTGLPITEGVIGSSVKLQIKFGLLTDSLLKGVMAYNCIAQSLDGKRSIHLINTDGCAEQNSPVSVFMKQDTHTIATQWFPLFTFEGSNDVLFQCLFDFCFDDSCNVGCREPTRHRRDAASGERTAEHATSKTIRVLPSVHSHNTADHKPAASVDSNQHKQHHMPGEHHWSYLMYINPVTCGLFLLLLLIFLIMYVSFLHTLRKSVENVRREIEGSRSRDKFLNCGCRKPLKDKDYVCP
ncbi:uncharacterized protein LOC131938010 [Physella acuta]|uniref:uncharacterized protein LOC131938010 n=1 Tax=Physella acuta TaxID=109671 RepID=UPI0027DD3D59|nr:uncharacterized protein LOC131938010 [Physella acuta]XP_059151792.1 uncharacterized protein LOC131938010 [Physella acuta]